MRYLTKSRFKLAMECPTKLFFTGKEDRYPSTKSEDAFLQALADGGFQVGAMATMRYPAGIEVTERDNAGALARTQALMSAHSELVLFEPAFAYQGLLVRVDILVKKGNQLQLIEVKAKSYNSLDPQILGARGGFKSGMLPYIEDVAFQKYVISQAMPEASIQCFLMMPNKAVTATVDGLNQCFKVVRRGKSAEIISFPHTQDAVDANPDLLALVPVDDYISMVMEAPLGYPGARGGEEDMLPQAAMRWARAYEVDHKFPPVIHSGCSKCEFRCSGEREDTKLSGYHECMTQATGFSVDQIDAGTVLDIWNFRGKDRLLAQGAFLMSDVQEEDLKLKPSESGGLSLSERQWLQVDGIPKEQDRGGYYFDADDFEAHRSKWRWPFHMIDFETCTVALPFFAGMRPYESVAFQFSHHIMHADGRIEHKTQALFARPGEFPNFEFVRALRKALSDDNGTIFRWAAHENSILLHIEEQLIKTDGVPDRDELIDFIRSVVTDKRGEVAHIGHRAMEDLNALARRVFFHPLTKGRTSIKKVLPAVMGCSTTLRQKYQQPIYGTQIASLNFKRGFAWIEHLPTGELRDPYERLKTLSTEMLGTAEADEVAPAEDDNEVEVAEGGAAAMAYARLQFEDLSPEHRAQIEQALLRYCELDTFAMVIILEAWLEWGAEKDQESMTASRFQ